VYVILVYDIKSDDKGQRVWSNVYKTCKKYLVHIQNSVFEGEISKSQLMRMKSELKVHLREDLDSLIVFKSRNESWLSKEFWTKEDDKTSNFV